MTALILSLILPVLVGVALLLLVKTFGSRQKKAKKVDHTTWQERAVWGWATIVSATRGTPDLSGRARVTMTLEVHTPGTPAYTAKSTWVVEAEGLQFVETGKEISLKVDPLDLQYVYPNVSWAKVAD